LQPEEITGLVRKLPGQSPDAVFGQVASPLTDTTDASRAG
jgi:hypothetical protein